MSGKKWDWQKVNWTTFEESLGHIDDNIKEAETQINALVDQDSVSDELHEALSNITSALVGLRFLVNLHHHHVSESERRG